MTQVAPEDCTGCGLCIEMCPAKSTADPQHKAIQEYLGGAWHIQAADNFFLVPATGS